MHKGRTSPVWTYPSHETNPWIGRAMPVERQPPLRRREEEQQITSTFIRLSQAPVVDLLKSVTTSQIKKSLFLSEQEQLRGCFVLPIVEQRLSEK